MAGNGGIHLGNGFQCLLYVSLAVAAHHTFYLQSLFHGLLLLHNGADGNRLNFFIPFRIADVKQIEPQGVGDHTEAGQAHGSCTEHGIQLPAQQGNEYAGCQGNAQRIVDKCPEQVFMNVAQGGTAQADGSRHIAETAVHQHHVRSVDGDVCACTNGHADVRPGQGRGVVNAVAHHGDTSMLLQLADDGFLAVGQYPGNHFIHTSLGTNGLSSTLIVAGEHHHTDAHVLELLHRLGTVFLDGVCHGNHAGHLIPCSKEQGCFALRSQGTGFVHEYIGHLHLFADEFHTAAQQHLAIQRGGQTVAGQSMKVGNGCCGNAFLLGGQHNSLGKGMLTESFQRNSQMKQICFGAICGNQIRYPGFATGDGAGFIQSDDLGFAGFLQGNGSLKKNAVLGTLAVADHNGNGCGQSQGTGAGDDQHADAP